MTLPVSNTPPYTITPSTGSRQIQNGGSSPGPSVISSLTIDVTDESVAGMYTCSGPSNFQTFQVHVPDDVTTSSSAGPGRTDDNAANLIAPVIGRMGYSS